METKVTNFVGIDISKLSFDAAIISDGQTDNITHRTFNKHTEFSAFLEWLESFNVRLDNTTVICMEFTGLYNASVLKDLLDQQAQVWMIMPMDMKRSAGLQRGKSDKIDAQRIALYALRHQDKMRLYEPLNETTEQLKQLLAQRDRLVDSVTRLKVPVEELRQEGLIALANQLEQSLKSALNGLEKSIAKTNTAIKETIAANVSVARQVEQLTSIPGIGPITALSLIVYTDGFKRLLNAKKLACYCGVVPFEHSSGTSVRGKHRVSYMANKKLKTLLHMAALAAIKSDNQLQNYYQRKVNEGKNKMSVINAVRNKLVHRAVAVIREQRLFIKHAA
jgi:transposase